MKIKVFYFAEAERIVGLHEEMMQFDRKSVGELLHYIIVKHPELNTLINRIAVAVNMEYANNAVLLKDGDTLAIIPPVQGG